MALIRCPECKKKISDKSETCVHCGYKLKRRINDEYSEGAYQDWPDDYGVKRKILKALGIIVGIIIAVLALGLLIFVLATHKKWGPLENEIMATSSFIVLTAGVAIAVLCYKLL